MHLVAGTVELVDAETEGRLEAALDVALPADWPPEFHGPEQLAFTREARSSVRGDSPRSSMTGCRTSGLETSWV